MQIANYNIGLNAKSSRMFEDSFEVNKSQDKVNVSEQNKIELEKIGERYSYSKDELELEKEVLVKTLESLYSIKDEIKIQNEKVKDENYNDTTTIKWDRGVLFDNAQLTKNTFTQLHKSQEKFKLNFEAKGVILTTDGKEINFDLNLNLSREFVGRNFKKVEFIDPLVINFDSPSMNLTSKKFAFDIDNDGFGEQISYLAKGSGFLALDKNNDGIINNGSELFGTDGMGGFAHLSLYDDDKNGFIDENDKIFDKLRIWRKNENDNSLVALGEVGIGAIYLGNAVGEYAIKDEDNNTLAKIEKSGVAIKENGDIITVQSLNFTTIKGDTKLDEIFNFGENFVDGIAPILADNQTNNKVVDITKELQNGEVNSGIEEQFQAFLNNQKIKFTGVSSKNKVSEDEKKESVAFDNPSSQSTKELALKNISEVTELKSKIATLEKELNSVSFELKATSSENLKIQLEQNVAKINSKITYNNLTIQSLKSEEFLASVKNTQIKTTYYS